METICTNFEGDWDECCSFCAKPHRDHQVCVGEVDGKRYVHYQPCSDQLRQASIEFGKRRGIFLRLVGNFSRSRSMRHKETPTASPSC